MSSLTASMLIRNGRVFLDQQAVSARGSWFMSKKIGDKYRFNPVLGEETGVSIFPGVFQGTRFYNSHVVGVLTEIEKVMGNHRSNSYQGLGNCCHDWTVGSFPLNLPLVSVKEYREELGLPKVASDDYLRHCETVGRLMRESMSFSDVKIKKKSQSGAPLFVAGQDKAKIFYYSLNNLSSIVDAYVRQDLESLLELHALGVYAPNVRIQAGSADYELHGDKLVITPKEKAAINPMYSLYQFGIIKDKPEATQLIDWSHPRPDISCGLLAARQRMIWSLNYVVNVYNQIVDGFVQSSMHAFPMSRIESHDLMFEHFNGFRSYAAWDFASYDSTQGPEVVDVFFKVFVDEVFTEDFASMIRYLYKSPALVPKFTREKGPENLVLGEPFSKSTDGGLLSGIAIVASMGKFNAICFMTYWLMRFTKCSLHEALYCNQGDFKVKVFSDDMLIGWKRDEWRDDFVDFMNKNRDRQLTYYNFKWEEFPRFLGPVYGEKRWHYNLSKLVESLLMVERDYTTKPNYFLGIQDKLDSYSKEEEFEPIYYILRREILKLDIDLDHIRSYQTVIAKNYSAEELEFVNNPDVIFYKYAPDYFPRELVEQFFTTVPVSVIKRKILPYVRKEYHDRF